MNKLNEIKINKRNMYRKRSAIENDLLDLLENDASVISDNGLQKKSENSDLLEVKKNIFETKKTNKTNEKPEVIKADVAGEIKEVTPLAESRVSVHQQGQRLALGILDGSNLKLSLEAQQRWFDTFGVGSLWSTPAPPALPGCCRRCRSSELKEVPIHGGESTRLDCARCGAFVDFGKWTGSR